MLQEVADQGLTLPVAIYLFSPWLDLTPDGIDQCARNDPSISQAAIADALGISRSAVAGHVMNLTAKGIIRGRGYVLASEPFVVVVKRNRFGLKSFER